MTLEERGAVASIFDHRVLLSGLRQVWQSEANHWLDQLKQEALKANKNTDLMIQYAAYAEAAETAELRLKEAVGL